MGDTANWIAPWGEKIKFGIWDYSAEWNDVGGVYLFCRFNAIFQQWEPIYIGQTYSFKTRLRNHEKWIFAVLAGAEKVLAVVQPIQDKRDLLEEALIISLQPSLNDRLKNAALSSAKSQINAHKIHVFISHAWSYSGHYQTLEKWIFSTEWNSGGVPLLFRDFSIPKTDPIHNAKTDKALKEAIFNKIRRSHVIVIPCGMYASYSYWIQKEIDGAKFYKKPILAVNPWAQQRKSSVVINNSDKQVGWNQKPVVQSVFDLFISATNSDQPTFKKSA
jgi:hypothetical protein